MPSPLTSPTPASNPLGAGTLNLSPALPSAYATPTVPSTPTPPVVPAPSKTPTPTTPVAITPTTPASTPTTPTTSSTPSTPSTPTPTTTTTTPLQTVSLPNGTSANYNPSTSAMTTSDGTALIYQNGQWVDPSTGQPPTTTSTGTSGTGIVGPVDANGNALLSDQPDRQALAQAQADYETQATAVSTAISNIENGVTPLNASEQAQVDGLQQQFQQLIAQQTLTNTGAVGSANIRGYQTGAAEYDPTFQVKTIGSIVSAGAAKIANLQVQEASAVAQLTESLQNNDISEMKDAFTIYQDAYNARASALQQTITDTTNAIATAQANYEQSIKDANDAQTLQLQQMMDDNTISYDDKQAALAQSTLDEKTKADLANEAIAAEVAQKGTYQVKTNPDGTTSIFNTATGQIEGSGSSPFSNSPAAADGSFSVSPDGSNTGFPEIDAAITYSAFGVPYIDTSNLSAAGKLQAAEVAKEYQQQTGNPLPIVTTANATVLHSVDTAKSNLDDMSALITENNLDASNFATKPFNSALNDVEGATEANADLASLQSYALTAIQIAKTMGAAGRINNQEIQLAQKSLPSPNDTVATVQQKLTNLSNILSNTEQGILGAQAFEAANPSPSSNAISTFLQSSIPSSTSGNSFNFSTVDAQYGL